MPVIIDYGVGNIGSIKNMFRKIGASASLGSTVDDIARAEMLVLPGVGAFDTGMRHLRASGLVDVLNQRVLKDHIPVLGICLGAQLMTMSSEEGTEKGLGWLNAQTLRMDFTGIPGKWPLPNVGWRAVTPANGYTMLREIPEVPRFYFVHSYYLAPREPAITSMTAKYGFEFACGLRKDNIHAAQFHPEKSHAFGMQFLRNFLEDYS
ncbi:MAG: imidazole glycerol phosphate synthase subunit HisH [Rhizobiaceae bacterium]|nr:imidazole glycerol phosphate synthase subunit HisH [Rhizobiaceae bacterium]MCZ8352533.1 imidazole glycerol phosphate synthase subunit HisH [Rhizobium sp.]